MVAEKWILLAGAIIFFWLKEISKDLDLEPGLTHTLRVPKRDLTFLAVALSCNL